MPGLVSIHGMSAERVMESASSLFTGRMSCGSAMALLLLLRSGNATLAAGQKGGAMPRDAKDLVNLERLEAAMARIGLDALIARAGLNFTYLAGVAYPGTLARHVDLADSPRAVIVVWPRRGEPRIVLNSSARDLA